MREREREDMREREREDMRERKREGEDMKGRGEVKKRIGGREEKEWKKGEGKEKR